MRGYMFKAEVLFYTLTPYNMELGLVSFFYTACLFSLLTAC